MQYDYEREYTAACDRTQSFNLNAPALGQRSPRQFSDRHCPRLGGLIYELVRELEPKDLVGQCFAVHLASAPLIEKEFGVSAVPTLGWISLSDEELFHTEEQDLLRYMSEGAPSRQMNLHCWLTLSSFEIVDITIATSFAIVNGIDKGLGGVLAKHWSELTGGVQYHPQLVGEEYLERTGMMLNIPMHQLAGQQWR
ncbi:hypothetical protein L3067_01785 [Xanthomonas sp. PPL568]|uniref:hypothetical protein n=1 Tax=Xanthomonas indica TaxID=2912242 RepID=UPI001F562F45|nr:hypothetical protein [Xanthomonas indica]MCI2243340.1 hypothetical protein [Xanthomonas indica]